jgi:hypothetical protein
MKGRVFAYTGSGVALCLLASLASAQPRQIGGVGLTVFADPDFRGRSATVRNDTANFQAIGINDKVSSLRVARGQQWEICEHANFSG